MAVSDSTPQQKILTVSELNRLAREILEMSFPLFWVSGEVSNFTRAASGHWYFSLKDAGAQVRCVMFKGRNSYVDFMPREGDKIEARATVTLYEARGDFQLTVEFIQKAGLGTLFEAFERLKKALSTEGLFDAARKRPIPQFPKAIGIVTSADAAALRDVLTTLKRRNPNIPVIIYPTPVQGKGAAARIAEAIDMANQRAEVDTLIVCRGGGSLEDLWSFNEEIVARAVYQSQIPVISGVGHETDFTICDFVADLRAATPTAAAEMACVDIVTLQNNLKQITKTMYQRIERLIHTHTQRLDYLAKRLISPTQKIQASQAHLRQLSLRLAAGGDRQLRFHQHRLQSLSERLHLLNPNQVLSRGYAIVKDAHDTVVSDVHQLSHQQLVHITFANGGIHAKIHEKNSP
ncbi:exodeoxyribonuclease VII large subunit [Methylotenera sp. N17]|uniref:exodeoxyribonuclease VII large subunit n=1 Tax=Methylotenera sp. N17 TaxID=1502761 RepID=UPI000648AD86|nr:exodeoxyribonuclease VII large subunit [Methylotenera sp. N17]